MIKLTNTKIFSAVREELHFCAYVFEMKKKVRRNRGKFNSKDYLVMENSFFSLSAPFANISAL